jgi:hypothetical protein
MPFIFALLFAVFVALIVGIILIAIAGFTLLMCIDIAIIALLVYFKYYLVLAIGIPLLIIIRTVLYRKQDLCAETCEKFTRDYCTYVENEDDIKKQRDNLDGEPTEDKPIEYDSSVTRKYAYILWSKPHVCHNRNTVCYSQDGKYKVTIQHTGWNNYLFFLKNYFTITREPLKDDERHENKITLQKTNIAHDEEELPSSVTTMITFVVTALFSLLVFILSSWMELLILGFLLFFKSYGAILVCFAFAVLITIIRTIRYRDVDIFAEECEYEVDIFRDLISDKENLTQNLEHLKQEKLPHVLPKSRFQRTYPYVIPWKPHICHNQATTLYSPDQKYKATIQHTAWHHYILCQKNEFTITEELLDHE